MEEMQIKNIVQRASQDEAFCAELTNDFDGVVAREGLSPRVAEVVSRMVPHLTFGFKPASLNWGWWHI